MPEGIPELELIAMPYVAGYAGGGRLVGNGIWSGPAGADVAERCMGPGIAYVIGEWTELGCEPLGEYPPPYGDWN